MTILFNNFNFMDIGLITAYLGLIGILFNKNNLLISIISIEVVFYGLNYYLVTSSLFLQDIEGFVSSFFILTVAAGESAIALGFLMAYFKIFKNILL